MCKIVRVARIPLLGPAKARQVPAAEPRCRHLHKQILIKDLHTHCLAGDNGWQLGGERDGRPERYVTHVLRGPQTIPDSGRDVQEKERQTDRQTDRESRKRRCDFEFFSCACPPDTLHPGGDTNVLSER